MENSFKIDRPGVRLSTRPLHFYWIADCSGSMRYKGKILSLNNAIRQSIPFMQTVADENPNAQLLVGAMSFSTGAVWHIPLTPIAVFKWIDLFAKGNTDMGCALSLMAEELKMPPMSDRALPPVLVLISDGRPTDNFNRGLKSLLHVPWGKKAVKLSIAIGEDAKIDILQKFIDHVEIKPFQANNPEALVKYIRWISTIIVKSVSSPGSQQNSNNKSYLNFQIPTDPESMDDFKITDVW